jgi:prepilin-type processing-associated H-X9-DG protein
VDAVGVLQMLTQFRLLLTAHVALADGHVELGRSQSALNYIFYFYEIAILK